MTLVALTQRIDDSSKDKERRDALDHRWLTLCGACNLVPMMISNHLASARMHLNMLPIKGVILTGGNSLVPYGGEAPERDEVEHTVLAYAIERKLPVLGVCRGMQMIQHYFGVVLHKVDGHVSTSHPIKTETNHLVVNSYHTFGTTQTVDELIVTARAHDGVVEEVRHTYLPVLGMMRHPERCDPITRYDLDLIKRLFT